MKTPPENPGNPAGAVTKTGARRKKIPFSQSLGDVKDARLFTVSEMAQICGICYHTMRSWIDFGKTPPADIREDVLAMLAASKTLSRAERRNAARIHGLTWEARKKRWTLRLTIDMGPRVVGKRVAVRISAVGMREAVDRKGDIIRAYQALGLTVKVRHIARGRGRK